MLTEKIEYNREYVINHPRTLFVFTDNTDRSSGVNLIDPNSWYCKKYGQGLKYPNITTAVVRGLENAYPISTQRWYHKGAKGSNGNWHDKDFEIFKLVIDDEINDICNALNSRKYTNIIFCSTIVNGHISNISKERTPKLYKYLTDKLNFLTKTYIQRSLF